MKSIILAASIFSSMLSDALADGSQSAMEAKQRMDALKDIVSKNGLDAFNVINGVSHGGSGSEVSGKGMGVSGMENTATLRSDDPRAFLFCVRDGRWAANQSTPGKVGQDAMSWIDANGQSITQNIIRALGQSGDGTATVSYSTSVPGVKDPATGQDIKQEEKILVYSSTKLLGKKNETGAKFFCGTSFNHKI